MKIGILTYHRVPNYGALLQAIAARVILQQMGHDVHYVDYYPEYHRNKYRLFSTLTFKKRTFRGKLRYLIEFIKFWPLKLKRRNIFNRFIRQHIEPFCLPLDTEYDAIIYGSDQIWRKQLESGDFNPIYFGGTLPAKKHIAYAVSMGEISLCTNDIYHLTELISHLDSISVREEGLYNLLTEKLNCTNVTQVLDPTLLISADIWNKIIPPKVETEEKYVLFYDLLSESFDREMVFSFAKERCLPVIELFGMVKNRKTKYQRATAGPDEFINLIRNADYVFTSSFHGLAFSLIFQKQVFASFSKNAQRAESLLKMIGYTDHLLTPMTKKLPSVKEMNYDITSVKLDIIKASSLDFLKSALD